MTRTSSKTTAKEKIVKSARSLILGNGYGGTSVDEIVKNADVSKGSFYHFFKSKEDLGLAALDDFIGEGGAIMMDGPFRKIEDPLDRALAFLKHVENAAKKLWSHGCLLVAFSVDTAGTHPKIRKETEKILEKLIADIATILKPLAEALVIEVKPIELARMYMAVIDGSIVYARATGDVGEIAKNLKTFRKQMEALLKSD